jgi:D-alanine--D-alanine ligase
MNKQRVAIIFGGVSNEYAVSLMSAVSIIGNLDRERFEPVLLGITREGRWLQYLGPVEEIAADRWHLPAHTRPAVLSPDRSVGGVVALADGKPVVIPIDIIFPAVHGRNCEDGALQGLLQLSGIPYVGGGVANSAICMDKEFTHRLMERSGVCMARWRCVRADEMDAFYSWEPALRQTLGYPMFVKPANSGSSVGASRAEDAPALKRALREALRHDVKAIVEEMLTGQEVECAVIGNEDPKAPLVGEIAPSVGFYDYDAKYVDDTAALYIPARIPEETALKIRELSVRIFRLLDCRGLARVDFFVRSNGDIVFNEVNTLPGFTKISMYPKLLVAFGMRYSELITALLDLAVENRTCRIG